MKHGPIQTQGAERNMVWGVWVILKTVGSWSSGREHPVGTLYIPVCGLWLGSSVKKLNNKAILKRGGARSAPGVGVGIRQRALLNYCIRAPGQAETNPLSHSTIQTLTQSKTQWLARLNSYTSWRNFTLWHVSTGRTIQPARLQYRAYIYRSVKYEVSSQRLGEYLDIRDRKVEAYVESYIMIWDLRFSCRYFEDCVFWDVKPCTLVECYRSIGEIFAFFSVQKVIIDKMRRRVRSSGSKAELAACFCWFLAWLMLLWNIEIFPDCTALQPRAQHSSEPQPWEPRIHEIKKR
jgi:hypothetical protein